MSDTPETDEFKMDTHLSLCLKHISIEAAYHEATKLANKLERERDEALREAEEWKLIYMGSLAH